MRHGEVSALPILARLGLLDSSDASSERPFRFHNGRPMAPAAVHIEKPKCRHALRALGLALPSTRWIVRD